MYGVPRRHRQPADQDGEEHPGLPRLRRRLGSPPAVLRQVLDQAPASIKTRCVAKANCVTAQTRQLSRRRWRHRRSQPRSRPARRSATVKHLVPIQAARRPAAGVAPGPPRRAGPNLDSSRFASCQELHTNHPRLEPVPHPGMLGEAEGPGIPSAPEQGHAAEGQQCQRGRLGDGLRRRAGPVGKQQAQVVVSYESIT